MDIFNLSLSKFSEQSTAVKQTQLASGGVRQWLDSNGSGCLRDQVQAKELGLSLEEVEQKGRRAGEAPREESTHNRSRNRHDHPERPDEPDDPVNQDQEQVVVGLERAHDSGVAVLQLVHSHSFGRVQSAADVAFLLHF